MNIASKEKKFLAFLIDWGLYVIGAIVVIILTFVGIAIIESFNQDGLSAIMILPAVLGILGLLFGIFVFYPTRNNGQTFGKKRLKIKTVKADGTAPGFGSYLARLIILYALSIFIYGIVVFFNEKNQSLGDLILSTYTVDA